MVEPFTTRSHTMVYDMEVQRSTKHRSLGMDPKIQPSKPKRPPTNERHKSAPLVPQIHSSSEQSRINHCGSRKDIFTRVSDREATVVGVRESFPVLNFVILGNARVGKTTFVRNALNLKEPIQDLVISSKVSLEGSRYRVQLLETELDEIEFSDGKPLEWPKPVGDNLFPTIDGVLCLYDVTDEDSIVGVPQALYKLSKSRLPVMLVACKVDAHISEQEVGASFLERVRRSFPLVAFGESAATSPESARKCLIVALKATAAIKKFEASLTETTNENSLRRKSDLTEIITACEPRRNMPPKPNTPASETDSTKSNVQTPEHGPKNLTPDTPDSYHHKITLEDAADAVSVLEMEQTSPVVDKNDGSIVSPSPSQTHFEPPSLKESISSEAGEGGVPFGNLVNRLLQLPVTKNDVKFVPAFLCLYRMFATPRQLLTTIIGRFEETDQSDLVALTKVAELLRYLQVLVQWTANYPGDFAESSLRRLAIAFIQNLEQRKSFAPASKEIFNNLLTIIMDDDSDWAYTDIEEHDKHESRRITSSSGFRLDANQGLDSDQSEDDRDVRRRSIRNSDSPSIASSLIRSSTTSSQSATNLSNLDSAREQSKLLKAIPHIPLSKIQWHQFMSTPTEELAREITRMDWTMYSAIRARDFVRHVSLSSQKRARIRHADTIGMMVKHFNHLALFVSGMILLRDKPKHRAQVLEKFMHLAWKVRQLNNYNSLGAIVAGITGPEIARLKQTYDLVPMDIQKQFLRLTVLMSISRSHAAYRMAWENSFSERIPFIPLVRQDLTMAAGANPTYIGNNINWKKFEIMGDVIVSVQRSHDQPYSFPEKSPKTQEITRLILETKVIGDAEDSVDPRGELYDRSVQLEPQPSTDTRKSMANFGVKRTMTGMFRS